MIVLPHLNIGWGKLLNLLCIILLRPPGGLLYYSEELRSRGGRVRRPSVGVIVHTDTEGLHGESVAADKVS